MARVGRGALVGLPAVGALFVAHLAHQDWHRLMEERAAGEGGMALQWGGLVQVVTFTAERFTMQL